MGKSKEQHEENILDIIVKNKVMKISHIFQHYTDLQRAQFYNLELDKSDIIKEAIAKNKSKAVSYMLNKWVGSDNATLQISAFKVLCEDEDRKKLSMQFVESENKHELKEFTVKVIDNNPDGDNNE